MLVKKLSVLLLPALAAVALPAHAGLDVIQSQQYSVQQGPVAYGYQAPAYAPVQVQYQQAPVQYVQPQVQYQVPVAPPAYMKPVSNRVFESGNRQADRDGSRTVAGWADQVPLEVALSQIVPASWSVYSFGVPTARSVSWSGGQSWVEVLRGVAEKEDFSVHIAWDSNAVLLFPYGAAVPQVNQLGSGRRLALGSCKDRCAGNVAPVVAPVSTVVLNQPAMLSGGWSLDPRLTLRGNVEAWAKRAGMNAVVWDAVDYEIVAPASFSGNFADENGPLAQVIRAYGSSDQPLQVRVSQQDRVVHVTNRDYQAPVVSPLTPREISPAAFSGQ